MLKSMLCSMDCTAILLKTALNSDTGIVTVGTSIKILLLPNREVKALPFFLDCSIQFQRKDCTGPPILYTKKMHMCLYGQLSISICWCSSWQNCRCIKLPNNPKPLVFESMNTIHKSRDPQTRVFPFRRR